MRVIAVIALSLIAAVGASPQRLDVPSGYLPCVSCDKTLERLSYACTLKYNPDFSSHCLNKKMFAVPMRPECLETAKRVSMRALELEESPCDMIGRRYMGNSNFQERLMECSQMECDNGGDTSGGIFSHFTLATGLGVAGPAAPAP